MDNAEQFRLKERGGSAMKRSSLSLVCFMGILMASTVAGAVLDSGGMLMYSADDGYQMVVGKKLARGSGGDVSTGEHVMISLTGVLVQADGLLRPVKSGVNLDKGETVTVGVMVVGSKNTKVRVECVCEVNGSARIPSEDSYDEVIDTSGVVMVVHLMKPALNGICALTVKVAAASKEATFLVTR